MKMVGEIHILQTYIAIGYLFDILQWITVI